MLNLTPTEIQAILTKYAKADVNIAKRKGLMCICETKKGNVEIEYNAETKRFQACDFNNMNTKHTDFIPFKEMVEFVATLYIIEG